MNIWVKNTHLNRKLVTFIAFLALRKALNQFTATLYQEIYIGKPTLNFYIGKKHLYLSCVWLAITASLLVRFINKCEFPSTITASIHFDRVNCWKKKKERKKSETVQ